MCRVLLHYFGVVQAPRTYTNHTILTSTELARCEGCLSTRAGWFKHIEPHRTYTNHTITEFALVSCRFEGVVEAHRTSSNLQETHHHRASTVCRVLLHYFGAVQALRTYTNHTIPELTVCRVLLHVFGVVQAQRTSSNLHEPHHHRESKV